MSITATLNLLTTLARTLTAAGMLLVMHRATALQWATASMTVSAVALVAALIMVTVEFGWPSVDPRVFQKRGAEGAEYALAASTSSAYNDLDKTMLSHYGMSAANGIYTMAYRAMILPPCPSCPSSWLQNRACSNWGRLASMEQRCLAIGCLNEPLFRAFSPQCACS